MKNVHVYAYIFLNIAHLPPLRVLVSSSIFLAVMSELRQIIWRDKGHGVTAVT